MLLPEKDPQDSIDSWLPVGPDDEVWNPPSVREMPTPPVVTSYQPLPTSDLSWETFEKLVFFIVKEVEGGMDFRLYGKRGQAQHGIDIVGFFEGGRPPTVYQAKRYQEFSERVLEEAVQKYADGIRPFEADRLVVAVACEATDTKIVKKLRDLRDTYPDITIELWDRENMSEKLRTYPWIIDRFFGRVWSTLVGGGDVYTSPVGMGIEADAILRGPIRHLDLADEVSQAEKEMGTNPKSASGRFERIASQLEESPFTAYAVRFRKHQAHALQKAGDLTTSARIRVDAAWNLIDYADLWAARGLVMDINRMPGELPGELGRSVEMLSAVVGWRLNYDRVFEHLIEAFDELRGSDPHRDRAALVLAEEAIAYRRFEVVRYRASSFLNIASTQTQNRTGQLISARLRCCVADATGDWGELSTTARQAYELPTAALVHARHARFLALKREPDRAKQSYLDAIQYSTLESNYGDAADWSYALRTVHYRYDESPNPRLNDFHYDAQALKACGEARVLAPAGSRTRAHVRMNSRKWPDALEALRQYIWHSTVSASWAEESEAHRMLGDLFVETNRYSEAMSHYIFAGAGDRAKDVAVQFPEDTLEFPPSLEGSPRWERATAFSLVANLADWLTDRDAASWAGVALQDALASPPSSYWSSHVYQVSAEAFAAVAELATKEDATRFLEHIAKNPHQLGKTFRDKAIVKALFGIARSHTNIRKRAISLVMDILLLAGDGAHMMQWSQGRDVLSEEKQVVTSKMEDAARSGNTTACLVLIDAECDLTPVVEHAKARLEIAIAAPQPGKTETEITIAHDGVLIEALDQRDKCTFVEVMLRMVTNPTQPLKNKRRALMAAAWLVRDLPETNRNRVFSIAVDTARGERYHEGPKQSANWKSDSLDRFQINLGPEDPQGEGLFCAACSATSDEQTAMIRQLVIDLLQKKDDLTGYRAARSMAFLPPKTFAQDIAMLSSHSNHWARSGAAIVWVKAHNPDPEIGNQLAADPDPTVRQWLASSLRDVPQHESVRQVLLKDPRRSVRRLVLG